MNTGNNSPNYSSQSLLSQSSDQQQTKYCNIDAKVKQKAAWNKHHQVKEVNIEDMDATTEPHNVQQ